MTKTNQKASKLVPKTIRFQIIKKILIICLILNLVVPVTVFAASTIGQNIITNGNLTVDGYVSTDEIQIGDPSNKIVSTGLGNLTIEVGALAASEFYLKNLGGSLHLDADSILFSSNNAIEFDNPVSIIKTNPNAFQVQDDVTYTSVLNVDTTSNVLSTQGSVGIGTSTPESPNILHLYAPSGDTEMMLDSTALAGGTTMLTFRSLIAPADIQNWNISINGLNDVNTGNIDFDDLTAGTTPFTIQRATGNVGIGTTTPSSPLNVVASDTWADYGVIAAQNPNRSASSTINALDSINAYQTYLGVGSPLANDYGPRMGSTGFINTQPIPFGITNGGLGLYQAANSGGIGFFNNRPRGLFDIGNFTVSTGVISFSDLPANGDTVTITDALATTVTYTFTNNNVGTNVQIEADIPNTLFNLQFKINADLDMDAYVDGDGTYIMLGQKTAGVAGDVPITKTGANISVIGMSGGSDFSGMADLYIDSITGNLITAHNIGIGTANPTSSLYIKTADEDSEITLDGSGATGGGTSAINFVENSQAWQISMNGAYDVGDNWNVQDTTAGTVPLTVEKGTGNVGLGTMFPGEKLEVNGGVMLNTTTAKPICDVTHRGTQWFTQGGAGVKDSFQVCAKDTTDTYAWRTIY